MKDNERGGAFCRHGGDGGLMGKHGGKEQLGRVRRRWDDVIKMDLQKMREKDVDWIDVSQGREK